MTTSALPAPAPGEGSGRGPAGPDATPRPPAPSGPSGLVRSSAVMAAGTAISRLTGFVRSLVLVACVGTALLGDAFTIANTLPNILYILLVGGALNTVFVPQLVRHLRDDDDRGLAYAQRLLTLVTIVLVVLTAVAMLAASPVVDLYGPRFTPEQHRVAVLFALWCLPQILFYGLAAMFQQVLNSRGSFAAPMFTPILNNVVSIAFGYGWLALLGFPHVAPVPRDVTSGEVALLGAGVTLGIAVQALALLPSLRAVGFSWRPRFDAHRIGLGHVGGLAGWTLLYVAANQVAYLVVARLATSANVAALHGGAHSGSGQAAYANAYLVFLLPHSIATVSIVTALLPRISRSAADGRLADLRAQVDSSLRLVAVLLLPASVFLVVFGGAVGPALYGRDNGGALGLILSAFAVGLLPFSGFYVLTRAFYAQEDTRTPALINLVINAVNVAAALAVYPLLPVGQRTIGLAGAYTLSYVVGFAVSRVLLDRRTPGRSDRSDDVRTYVRVLAAALVAAVPAGLVQLLLVHVAGLSGRYGLLAATAASGLVYVAVYVLLARAVRVSEVTQVADLVLTRLGRRARRSRAGGRTDPSGGD